MQHTSSLIDKVRQVVLRHVLSISKHEVSYKPLIDELGDFGAESLLNIRISDVVKPDRMDFRASQRLFSKSVIMAQIQVVPDETSRD